MILMFMENNEIVGVAKVELKKNFMPFDGICTNFYACSSN